MESLPKWPAYLDCPPPDPYAVAADRKAFGLVGDGEADDAPALQAAIDAAAESGRRGGIVLLPEGEYRLGSTVNLWRGVRMIGTGRRRPRLLLRTAEPAFAGPGRRYLLHFRHSSANPEEDACNDTFFSGLFGLSFVVEAGYPEVAVLRYRVAQHGLVRQCDFSLAEDTFAAIDQAGYIVEECDFRGGRYGITSLRTSASWPFCVRACRFVGQTEAALATSRAGLTLLDSEIADTPVGCAASPDAPEDLERLLVQDCRFRRVGHLLRRFSRHAAEQQLTLRRLFADECGRLAAFADETETSELPFAANIEEWQCGMAVDGAPAQGAVELPGRFLSEGRITPAAGGASGSGEPAWEKLPAGESWANARDFGAVGDGRHDDTKALRAALAASANVYLPMGRYRLRETLEIPPGKRLFGLHPGRTMLSVRDGATAFAEAERPRALVRAHAGTGTGQHVRGIGFKCGNNPGAVGVDWEAGADSLLEDVYFYSRQHGRDPEKERCGASLRVRGAGRLRNIWSADVAAECGLHIADTEGPLHCLMLSVEHHRASEVRLERARGLEFLALQTEENQLSPETVAIEMEETEGIRFLNTYLYRVFALQGTPPQAVKVRDGTNLRFDNLHVFSWGPYPFASSVFLADKGIWVRQRELVRLAIGPHPSREPK